MTWDEFGWFGIGVAVTLAIGGLAFMRFLFKMNKRF